MGTTGQASSSRGLPLFSLLPSPILSSAFALWENAELYILVLSLTNLCPVSLPLEESCKYLSILMLGLYVIIKILEESVGRTMWGPCMGHKRTKFWQFNEQKGATEQVSFPRGLLLFSTTSQPSNFLCLCPLSKRCALHLGLFTH